MVTPSTVVSVGAGFATSATGTADVTGCVLTMAFSVATKAARLAGSFSTSSAERAWSADSDGAAAGAALGFWATASDGTQRASAHSRKMRRVIRGYDHRCRCPVNANPDPRPRPPGIAARQSLHTRLTPASANGNIQSKRSARRALANGSDHPAAIHWCSDG